MDRGLVAALVNTGAIVVMVFGLYFPRHRRRDLVVAYLGVNVGVLAVASVLSTAGIGVGLGLGLFGVLSIIRLRSIELSQPEVAYYFAALALGLLGGLSVAPIAESSALMGLVVAALFVGDHPRLFRGYRHQLVVLERAYTDERALRAELERRLEGRVRGFTVTKLDLVNEMTWVDVRYTVPPASTAEEVRPLNPVAVLPEGERSAG
ncbi:MAG TPA: DUF4956 domain-containing protein [Gaiellaceae bacterium]|nr:DUF4956 domain-containing protein [Gaiellaceae bacterium]